MSLGLISVSPDSSRIYAAIDSRAVPTPEDCGPILKEKVIDLEQGLVLLWTAWNKTWSYVAGQYVSTGRNLEGAVLEVARILSSVPTANDCRGYAYALIAGFTNGVPQYQRISLNGDTGAVSIDPIVALTRVVAIGTDHDAVARAETFIEAGLSIDATLTRVIERFCRIDPATYALPIATRQIDR